MYLLLASGLLDFVSMDIDGSFSKAAQGIQYTHVITDRYCKLTRAIQTSGRTATHVTNLFMDHWLIPYRITTYLLTDYGTQFVSMFFAAVCALLGVKH